MLRLAADRAARDGTIDAIRLLLLRIGESAVVRHQKCRMAEGNIVMGVNRLGGEQKVSRSKLGKDLDTDSSKWILTESCLRYLTIQERNTLNEFAKRSENEQFSRINVAPEPHGHSLSDYHPPLIDILSE
jgi:hypothetical protein